MRRDHSLQQPHELVDGTGPAAVPPRVPARTGDREPGPQRAHGGDEYPVGTMAFEGQHGLGRQLAAGVPGAAQPAEAFLADGEDDSHRQWSRPARQGEDAFGDGHGGRDGDRVVTDPGTAQPAVPLRDAPYRGVAEDVVHVNQHGQAVGPRAERPHQVARLIDIPVPWPLRQAPLQPVDAHGLVASAAVQLGQRHGIGGDRRRIEGPVPHVTPANRTRIAPPPTGAA